MYQISAGLEYKFASYSDFSQVCEKMKRENKTKKTRKLKSLLTHLLKKTLCNFLQIWCVVFLGRWALPQQCWCSLNKRSWNYKCVKIVTLLFLLWWPRRTLRCGGTLPLRIALQWHTLWLQKLHTVLICYYSITGTD